MLLSTQSSDFTYAVGTTLKLTAVPNPGCVFTGFGGAFSTNETTLVVNPKNSMTEVAHFNCD